MYCFVAAAREPVFDQICAKILAGIASFCNGTILLLYP